MEILRRIAYVWLVRLRQPGWTRAPMARHYDAIARSTGTGVVEAGRLHASTWTMRAFRPERSPHLVRDEEAVGSNPAAPTREAAAQGRFSW